MAEWVAVVLTKRAFGGGTNVGKYKSRCGLGGDTMEVGAIPCGNGRGEEAGCGS